MSFYRCPKCDKLEAQARTTCTKCGYHEAAKPAVGAGALRGHAGMLSRSGADPPPNPADSTRATVAKWLRRGAIVTACLGPVMVIAMCSGVPLIPLHAIDAKEIFLVGVVLVPVALYVLSRLLSLSEPLGVKIRRG